ncbi:autotransporter outer membrane beta-barrel domain-containing protein [Roseibium sp. HPY-6]|uniref:autotransporter outer membrane beta-barrel domain-containing protein n=1 Tax=Roseibium sp. HPY-6 TaxID=3229852 RepID=UPI00338FFDC6
MKDKITGFNSPATNSLNNQTAGVGGRQILLTQYTFTRQTQVTRFVQLSNSTVTGANGFSYSVRALASPFAELTSGTATRTGSTVYSNVTLGGNNTNLDEFSISGLTLEAGTYWIAVHASDGNAYQVAANSGEDPEPLLADSGGVPFVAGSNFHMYTILYGINPFSATFDEQKSIAFNTIPVNVSQVNSISSLTLALLNRRLSRLQNNKFLAARTGAVTGLTGYFDDTYLSGYEADSSGSSPFPDAALGTNGSLDSAERPGRIRVWSEGSFVSIEHGTTGSFDGYDGTLIGGHLGADIDITESLAVGLAYGRNYTDTDYVDDLGNTQSNSDHFSAFAQYIHENGFYSNLIYSYGHFDLDLDRNAGTSGAAKASTHAGAHSVQGTVGYRFPPVKAFTTSVESRLWYTNINVDGYSESNAGSGSLSVDEQNADNVSVAVGFNARYNHGNFSPYLSVFYQYNNLDLGDATISLLQDPSLTATQQYIGNDGGSVNLDIGLDYAFGGGLSLGANYATSLSDGDLEYHGLNLALNYVF